MKTTVVHILTYRGRHNEIVTAKVVVGRVLGSFFSVNIFVICT